jgi:uncharacterized protein Usg
MSERSLQKQLEGYRLTTAEILYRLPDHPHLVQSFIWQQLDIAPRFPELQRFLAFWEEHIEGRLHSVKVAQASLVGPAKLRHAQVSLSVH